MRRNKRLASTTPLLGTANFQSPKIPPSSQVSIVLSGWSPICRLSFVVFISLHRPTIAASPKKPEGKKKKLLNPRARPVVVRVYTLQRASDIPYILSIGVYSMFDKLVRCAFSAQVTWRDRQGEEETRAYFSHTQSLFLLTYAYAYVHYLTSIITYTHIHHHTGLSQQRTRKPEDPEIRRPFYCSKSLAISNLLRHIHYLPASIINHHHPYHPHTVTYHRLLDRRLRLSVTSTF